MKPIIIAAAIALCAAPAAADWSASAQSRGQDAAAGQAFAIDCPPGGAFGTVWGTGLYTSDSNLCTAAVHAGHLDPARGGTVRYMVLPGIDGYAASSVNGVATQSYGAWGASVFIMGSAGAGTTYAWGDSVASLGLDTRPGTIHEGRCPPRGAAGTVWGTGIYTHDSSLCTAAVHAGRITLADGGPIRVVMSGPQDGYTGSTQNGIASSGYGAWDASFAVR